MNTMRPEQNERHLAVVILKYICLNENYFVLTTISLKFVPMGQIEINWY